MRKGSLNHTYRLIWSEVTKAFVAVAETTKAGGKRSGGVAGAVALAVTLMAPGVASADCDPADIIIGTGGIPAVVGCDVNVSVTAVGTYNGDLNPFAIEVPLGIYSSDFTVQTGASITANAGASGNSVAILFNGDVTGNILNNGALNATANNGYATGIAITSNLSGSLTNSSTGSINITGAAGDSTALWGLYVDGVISGDLSNAGTITVENDGSDAWALGIQAYGGLGDGEVGASISNSGLVDVTVNGNDVTAFGIATDGIASGSELINTEGGEIKVTANGILSSGWGYANAVGVLVGNTAEAIIGTSSTPRSYYGSTLAGQLTNAGTITVSANSVDIGPSSDQSALATGIYAGNIAVTGALSNSGTITVTASSESDDAEAYGLRITDVVDGVITNSNTINVTANSLESNATAYGIYVNGNLNGVITNTNTGTIDVTAVSGTDTAYAYGVYVNNSIGIDGGVTNSGTIDVSATAVTDSYAYAYGLYVRSDVVGNVTNSSTGTINVTASVTDSNGYTAYAYGIGVRGSVEGSVANLGTINVTSTNVSSNAKAYGIYVGNDINAAGSVTNSGSINVTATSPSSDATAYGVYVGSNVDGALTNGSNGTINVTASSETGSAEAYGVYVSNLTTGTVTNLGTITATADGGGGSSAAGLYVSTNNGTIDNYGIIHGAADGGEGSSLVVNGGTGIVRNFAGAKLIGQLFVMSDGGVTNDGEIILKNSVDITNATTIRDTGTATYSYINGDYTQGNNGVLHIAAASDDTEGGYSRLYVEGSASIAGTAFVDVKSVNTLAVGQTLEGVVYTGGNLTGNFSAVGDNSALFNFTSLATEGESGFIDFAITKGLTVTEAVTTTGNDPALGVAGALDGIIDGGNAGGLQGLVDDLGTLQTEQQVSDAVSQLLPLMTASQVQATQGVKRNVSRFVQARQEGQHGRSSGEQFFGDQKFWMKPFGSWADQDNRKGVSGFDADTYGVIFGADAVISDETRLGLALSYAKTDVNSNSSVARQKSDIDSYQVTLYGSTSLSATTDVSFQADIAKHENDGRRYINIGPSTTGVAKSDYDTWSAHVGAGIAHTMSLSDKTSFTPSVRADYTWMRDESYSERGTAALNVGSQKTEELILSVDGKLAHQLSDRATFTANLGAGYDLINERSSVTAAFAGSPSATFTTKGLEPSPWLMRGGFGVVGNVTETVEVTARYDAEVREDFDNQTASVKVRWSF